LKVAVFVEGALDRLFKEIFENISKVTVDEESRLKIWEDEKIVAMFNSWLSWRKIE